MDERKGMMDEYMFEALLLLSMNKMHWNIMHLVEADIERAQQEYRGYVVVEYQRVLKVISNICYLFIVKRLQKQKFMMY